MGSYNENMNQGIWTREEGFYGKTCNYAFPCSKEGYVVFFLG